MTAPQTCVGVRRRLPELARGDVPAGDLPPLLAHLRSCMHCRRELGGEMAAGRALRLLVPGAATAAEERLLAGLRQAVLAGAPADRRRPGPLAPRQGLRRWRWIAAAAGLVLAAVGGWAWVTSAAAAGGRGPKDGGLLERAPLVWAPRPGIGRRLVASPDLAERLLVPVGYSRHQGLRGRTQWQDPLAGEADRPRR